MRWHSTHQSVEDGEISVLAIVETIVAMSISAVVAIKYGIVTHIAISCSIAPFLLLATDESREFGLKWMERCLNWCHRKLEIGDRDPNNFETGIGVFALYILPALVRFFSILVCFPVAPLKSIRRIPLNWSRFSLSLDLSCAPEVVPGAGTSGKKILKISVFPQDCRNPFEFVIAFLLNLTAFSIPLMYRLSIKSTTVVYLPFLFIVKQTFNSKQSTMSRLKEFRNAAWFKLVRVVSVILIVVFAVKLTILITEQYQAQWFKDLPAVEILSLYWLPGKLALWQVAAAFNSLLSFALFFFVDFAIRRLESGTWSESYITTWLHSLFLIRGSLSIYTIFCSLYITLRHASNWSWDWLDFAVFPW